MIFSEIYSEYFISTFTVCKVYINITVVGDMMCYDVVRGILQLHLLASMVRVKSLNITEQCM